MLSTGSPLAPSSFDFVYRSVKQDLQLSSIAGGTDIISCFALGNPLLPVYRGELQCRGLGMKVEIFDASGRSVRGEKGELVCTAPFPSMPVGFWNDADDRKYHAAYFERFPERLVPRRLCELTERGGVVIYGRSDAVLNPGGVRIGTAEIYRIVEQFDEVAESVVVGQDWEGDERIVLFVRLQPGQKLDAGARAAHPRGDPREGEPAPRAGENPHRSRHPADDERQDRRARRARRDPRPRRRQPRGARESGGARSLPRSRRARGMTGPLDLYRRRVERGELAPDPAQAEAVEALQRLYDDLVKSDPRAVGAGRSRKLARRKAAPIRGVYLWGGVGRGKTFLMDLFYGALPFDDKLRATLPPLHGHVHDHLKELRDRENPLELVADRIAAQSA